MPLTWSLDQVYIPSMARRGTPVDQFHLWRRSGEGTGFTPAPCCVCADEPIGVAWVSAGQVLCLPCAESRGAPVAEREPATVPAPQPEPEPDEDTETCAHCDGTVPTDSMSDVHFRANSGAYSSVPTYSMSEVNSGAYRSERWCEGCTQSDATYIEGEEEYWRDTSIVRLTDTDESVSIRHARAYCTYREGEWYSSQWEGPAEDEEREDDDTADADDTGHAYRYGKNVLREHNWPENVPTDALCFGVELEVEPQNDTHSGQVEITEALGGKDGGSSESYILTVDGSLDHGIEVITVPQTLEQHHRGDLIPWRAITKSLASVKAKSGAGTDNCGMHVHINRAALSALTVGKMLVLINSERMRPLVELVAQRPASRYCARKAKKITDALRPEDNADHYDALNIGTEHKTLELRIFRGNTRHSRIMKNLEFAHALCIYCRDTSIQDIEKPSALRTWIGARSGMYPNLSKFLTERLDGDA